LFGPHSGLLSIGCKYNRFLEYWTHYGTLEYWNNGMLGGRVHLTKPIIPVFHYSSHPTKFSLISSMRSGKNPIHWEILEAQAQFFHRHALEHPERIIKEARVIKEGHRRTVYRHKDDIFYIKRMRPGKAKKEWRNWKRLHKKGVPTITPVALGVSRDYGYLISIAHHDWTGLYESFDAAGPRHRVRLLQELGEVIRTMHRAGFYHGDLHGGNFLARWNGSRPEVRMVDFQRGRFWGLSHRQRLKNLADLAVSRFFDLGVRERLAFLTGYWGGRAAAFDFVRREGKRLEWLILGRSSRVADRKVRRFRRVNKYFERLTTQKPSYKGTYFRENRDRIPPSFLSSPLVFLYRNDVDILKDTRSVRVVRYRDICVKYYKRRSPKDVLKGWLGLSKGKKSFRWALALFYRRIPTPEPLCYLDGPRGDSFYLCLFADSAEKLVEHLRDVSPAGREACLQALSSFLKTMFYRGVYHRDLKGSNILVRQIDRDLHFCLIDTDGIAIFWKGSQALLRRSLLRMTRALSSYVGRAELIAFVEACLSGLPTRLGMTAPPKDLVDRALKIEDRRAG